MSKDFITIALALLVALMPFLGFPNLWETVILVVLGLTIATLVFTIRRGTIEQGAAPQPKPPSDVYVENGVHVGEGTLPHTPLNSDSHPHAHETQKQ